MTYQQKMGQNARAPFAENFRRKPLKFALAGLFGVGLCAVLWAPIIPFSVAESQHQRAEPLATFKEGMPLSFADLVERVRPAVVSVSVKNGKNKGQEELFRNLPDLPKDHPLNEFFKRFRKDNRTPGPRRPALSQGSGFIISKDGYVVTNHHVVDNASKIQLTMDDGLTVDAELIGGDPRTDIALLKIKTGGPYPFVTFSDKPARVGDWVLAVGNPFGLGGTVTAGIVSARGRDIGSGPYDYLQIDAAVNRGNSGGPAFNINGQVVGVNTAIFSPSGGNVGIAFAVPADLTRNVIAQLKADGSVSRGWLGVTIQNVTEDIAESLGLEKPSGAMISKISKDGPAEKSDLKVGDAILAINDQEIKDSRDLARTIAELNPKSKAKVTVFRNGGTQNIIVKLGRFPGLKKLAKLEQEQSFGGEEMKDLGLSLAPAQSTPGAGEVGVVITNVDPSSKAAEKGLKQGDVILEINGQPVSLPGDVVDGILEAKKKGRKAVLMRVRSGNQQRFIALPVAKS